MNIWIFNHYATETFFDKGGRHYSYAKYLIQKGNDVSVFCANTIHGTEKRVEMSDSYVEKVVDEIRYVFIRCVDYDNNSAKRIINMFNFYFGLKKIYKQFKKPDIIIGSQVHPLACLAAIQISKKIKCKCISEFRDLWPTSIVEYSNLSEKNILIRLMYKLEKTLYIHSDGIIFTMPGGIDYLRNKKYADKINFNYVFYLNNGVDLDVYNFNKDNFIIKDPELESSAFKIMYTGSLRPVNGINFILDILSKLDFEFNFFLYGKVSNEQELKNEISKRNLNSKVKYKGVINKNYIPYILSRSDITIIYWKSKKITKRGISANKMFDYLAAGKPIISNNAKAYDFIEKNGCGFSSSIHDDEDYAAVIKKVYLQTKSEKEKMKKNVLDQARNFDYKVLANHLDDIINDVKRRKEI